jgi:hypothetical protein
MSHDVVINACYGGFGLSDEAMDRMVELGYELKRNPEYKEGKKSIFNYKYEWDYDILRHHPILVQVVRELGEKANGMCARLEIRQVHGLYRIDEYDGYESIIECGEDTWIAPAFY